MNSLESFVKFIPSSSTTQISVVTSTSPILTDVEAKAKKLANTLTDALYENSNEPSLGLYRIQEHIRKSIPTLIEKKTEIDSFETQLQGNRFDLDYSIDAVKNVAKSDAVFESIEKLLTDSLFNARQFNMKINQKPSVNISPITKSNTFVTAAPNATSSSVSSTISSNNLQTQN